MVRRFDAAEAHFRECLDVAMRRRPERLGECFTPCRCWGEHLVGQERYADAEPLLLKGYEGMKQRNEKSPASRASRALAEAAKRLVEL